MRREGQRTRESERLTDEDKAALQQLLRAWFKRGTAERATAQAIAGVGLNQKATSKARRLSESNTTVRCNQDPDYHLIRSFKFSFIQVEGRVCYYLHILQEGEKEFLENEFVPNYCRFFIIRSFLEVRYSLTWALKTLSDVFRA